MRGSGHAVPEQREGSAAGEVDGLAASVGAGDEATLGGGHGRWSHARSRLVENDSKRFEIERIFEEALQLSGPFGGGEANDGALVMPSRSKEEEAPPERWMASQPLLVLATRQPLVVAMGTVYSLPSSNKGPATPTGICTNPLISRCLQLWCSQDHAPPCEQV